MSIHPFSNDDTMIWNNDGASSKVATDEDFKKAGYLTIGEIDEMIAKKKAQESTDELMTYMRLIQEKIKLTQK